MREDVQKISVAKTEHEEGGRRGRMGTVRRRRVYTKKNRTEEKDEAYMRAHKMVEDLKMGRMDVSGGEL